MRISDLFLVEDAAEQKAQVGRQIIKQFKDKWAGIDGYDNLEKFVGDVLKADPSLKGSYAPWLARLLIKNPAHNRAEDLDRTAKDLKVFDTFKHKMDVKDINQFKTFADLYTAIDPFLPKKKKGPKSAEEKAAAKLEKVKEGIIDVYSGPEGWIKIPTTKQAAQFISQNTRWCTGAKSNNMFDHYNKSDRLFVIYDKETKARSQLHIETGQHADVTDKMIGMDAVPTWARSHIVSWYKKHKGDDISIKHAIAFASMGHADAAEGTEHAEVIDLMKKYGVV